MVSDWEGRWCRHCVARSGALGVDIRTPGRVGYVLRDSTRWPAPLGVSPLSRCAVLLLAKSLTFAQHCTSSCYSCTHSSEFGMGGECSGCQL